MGYRLLAGLLLAAAAPAAAPLGPFEGQADIGSPKLAGSATYADGRFRLSAGGANIARAHDEFHFVWRRVSGDFSIQARVAFDGPGLTPHRKAGLMARAGLGDASAHVDATVHGDGPRSMVVRRVEGGQSDITELEPREPVGAAAGQAQTVRLDRHGDRFGVTLGRPGRPDLTSSVEVAMPRDLYVGLFLSAHNPEVVETATIDQVRLATR